MELSPEDFYGLGETMLTLALDLHRTLLEHQKKEIAGVIFSKREETQLPLYTYLCFIPGN